MSYSVLGETNVFGTSLQGYVSANYYDLVELLGEPTYMDPSALDDKVTTEWALDFEDGHGNIVPVTIYDWKEFSLRCREDAVYNWHIGGKSSWAVHAIETFLEENMQNSRLTG